ncbi:hypothetical protein [Chengkuizengella axinellae]|uniref:Uncharacterized protein n=1 Tax=Chengkuizengella axinellae TaxID=3064388 RepID=A0ABT9J434_9BACL|nr:hypothetical protein [Chengkuizengella sp. 2205SS18-9]MDP5276333.1 hypothetical protein [Chengkuizengella sp. 2205SS18-9]
MVYERQGELIFITTGRASEQFIITEVKNFILFGDDGEIIPVCNLASASTTVGQTFTVNLKPIRKSTKVDVLVVRGR